MEEGKTIETKVEPLNTENLGSSNTLKVEPPDSPTESDELEEEGTLSAGRVVKVEIEIAPTVTSDRHANVPPPLPGKAAVGTVQNNEACPAITEPRPRIVSVCKGALLKEVDPKTPGKPIYLCRICNKTFFMKSRLDIHVSIHAGKVPHRCEVCKKTFVQKSNLNRHMLIHSGRRPYRCEVCSTSFFEKGHLKTHMFTHSHQRPRPYHCHLCPRSFFQRGHLDTHLLTHSGLKPHICDICDRSFSKKTNLNRHRSIHR